jgi:hypothetical protein
MPIEFKDFTGVQESSYKPNATSALAQLNDWEEANSETGVICIESLYSDHPSTMTTSGGRDFIAFRCWHRT